MKPIDVPLQTFGYIGHLTPEQTGALALLWLAVLNFFSINPAEAVDLKKIGPTPSATPVGSTSSLANDSEMVVNELQVEARDASSKVVTKNELKKELWLALQDNHPHSFLLRFLRARKFDVRKSLDMLLGALHWRVLNNVQRVIEEGEAIVEELQMNGKAFFYKTDKWGRPIIFINVALHLKNGQDAEMLKIHTIYLMETARLFLKEPVGTVTIIYNMTDFGTQNMDNEIVKFLLACLQTYYPESLGICLIVNAPWVFSGIWMVIKPWLDAVVQAKVHFLKSFDDLKEFIKEEDLAVVYKGKDPYEYNYLKPTEKEIQEHRIELNDEVKRGQLLQDRFKAAAALERIIQRWASGCVFEYHPDKILKDPETGKTSVAVLKGWNVPIVNINTSESNATGNNKSTSDNASVKSKDTGNKSGISVSLSKLNLHDEEIDLDNEDLEQLLKDLVRPSSADKKGGALWETWWAYDDYVRFKTYWHRIGAVNKNKVQWDQAKQVRNNALVG